MTDKQFEIISKAFVNFFSCERGNVWTNLDIANPLEDLQFEDLSSWEVQKMVESKLRHVLETQFKALDFKYDETEFILDRKNRELSIHLVASLKNNEVYRTFIIEPLPKEAGVREMDTQTVTSPDEATGGGVSTDNGIQIIYVQV